MSGMKKNSILIVDDDKMNLKSLTHILNPEYTIFTAKDGPTAIKTAKEYMPDLILLDVLMPGMNGYEVLSALRTFDKTRKIPIVFITGLNSAEDEEKGLALEAADYIGRPFSAAIVKLRVRNQIQIVNQIRTIDRLSTIDQLTGLPNRRGFDNQLSMEWGRAIREKLPINVLMIDVDHFKLYNDTHGHQQGDVALQTVANVFTQTLKRSSDYAARWGGEEFAVLLPNTDLNGALDVAETIRAEIEQTAIPGIDGSVTRVTISIGVNTQIPTPSHSIDDFIFKVDKALYTAKKTGRNRICTYDGD